MDKKITISKENTEKLDKWLGKISSKGSFIEVDHSKLISWMIDQLPDSPNEKKAKKLAGEFTNSAKFIASIVSKNGTEKLSAKEILNVIKNSLKEREFENM